MDMIPAKVMTKDNSYAQFSLNMIEYSNSAKTLAYSHSKMLQEDAKSSKVQTSSIGAQPIIQVDHDRRKNSSASPGSPSSSTALSTTIRDWDGRHSNHSLSVQASRKFSSPRTKIRSRHDRYLSLDFARMSTEIPQSLSVLSLPTMSFRESDCPDDDTEENSRGTNFVIEVPCTGQCDNYSVLSKISMHREFGDSDNYDANAAFETIPAVVDFVAKSWTIRILDNDRSGDTTWFRIFRNGRRTGYLDLEDDEIVSFAQTLVTHDDDISFYIDYQDHEVCHVGSATILPFLSALLSQAKLQMHTLLHPERNQNIPSGIFLESKRSYPWQACPVVKFMKLHGL